MPKLIIFDFDGTLADSAAWMARALNQAADRFGFRRVSDAEIEMLRGHDSHAVIRYLGVPAWKLPRIARHLRERVAADAANIPLFPGTHDMLRLLAERGMATAVVSSNSEANVRRILGPGSAPLIGCYECGASLFGKAARFQRVLKRTGVAKQAVICIGDEARDIEAASGLGLASGAATWGYATPESLERQRPTMVFERMGEILERLTVGNAADSGPS